MCFTSRICTDSKPIFASILQTKIVLRVQESQNSYLLSFNLIYVSYYLTKSRQKSRMQKFFVIMMIFLISLLVYANGIAFNLFSAPMFANDIIAYVALAVAVTFAAIVSDDYFQGYTSWCFFTNTNSHTSHCS